jgi:glycosyltransferase involved in cell wall biosynthesis
MRSQLPQPAKQSEPLLSLIIPTRNRAQYLDRCLASVFHEIETDYPRTEVIVIDGGSTDGTIEILKRHGNRISYWVSEPDSGVSEAANKGIEKATGEIIRFLGDDDELIPGNTSQMMSYLSEHPNIDILLGHAAFFSQNGDEIKPMDIKQPVGPIGYRDLLDIGKIGWPSPEVSFNRRAIFEEYGGYDTRFHYLAYLEIWLRFAKKNVSFHVLPRVIANRFLTSDSDTIKGDSDRIAAEMKEVLNLHGDLKWLITKYYRKKAQRQLHQLCNRLGIHPLRAIRLLSQLVKKKSA